eukprot:111906-Hanusia_phi.AAC.1
MSVGESFCCTGREPSTSSGAAGSKAHRARGRRQRHEPSPCRWACVMYLRVGKEVDLACIQVTDRGQDEKMGYLQR